MPKGTTKADKRNTSGSYEADDIEVLTRATGAGNKKIFGLQRLKEYIVVPFLKI